jgi:hypothetical protein
LSEKRQTYNLTVEGTSTYFVGRNEVLVHNTDCTKGLQIKDATGNMAAELDRVVIEADPTASKIVEQKSAWGLRGKTETEMETWASENIYNDAVGKISAIQNTGVSTTLQTGVGTATGAVPTLADLQAIRNMEFAIENGDSVLLYKVEQQLVESRRGAVTWASCRNLRSVSSSRSSNATCGFPALRSPAGFTCGPRRI